MNLYMQECIFCHIVKGEIPAYTIFEDDNFIAFLDIYPRVAGHTLVIPKKHYRWVYDVPEFSEYWEVARIIGMRIQQVLGSPFISYVTVGEEVHHAHIHILPQPAKGTMGLTFGPVIKMTKEEMASMTERINQKRY